MGTYLGTRGNNCETASSFPPPAVTTPSPLPPPPPSRKDEKLSFPMLARSPSTEDGGRVEESGLVGTVDDNDDAD